MLTLLHTLDKRLGVKDRSGSRMLTAVLQLRRPADATDLLLRRVARTAGLALEVRATGEGRPGLSWSQACCTLLTFWTLFATH